MSDSDLGLIGKWHGMWESFHHFNAIINTEYSLFSLEVHTGQIVAILQLVPMGQIVFQVHFSFIQIINTTASPGQKSATVIFV